MHTAAFRQLYCNRMPGLKYNSKFGPRSTSEFFPGSNCDSSFKVNFFPGVDRIHELKQRFVAPQVTLTSHPITTATTQLATQYLRRISGRLRHTKPVSTPRLTLKSSKSGRLHRMKLRLKSLNLGKIIVHCMEW